MKRCFSSSFALGRWGEGGGGEREGREGGERREGRRSRGEREGGREVEGKEGGREGERVEGKEGVKMELLISCVHTYDCLGIHDYEFWVTFKCNNYHNSLAAPPNIKLD